VNLRQSQYPRLNPPGEFNNQPMTNAPLVIQERAQQLYEQQLRAQRALMPQRPPVHRGTVLNFMRQQQQGRGYSRRNQRKKNARRTQCSTRHTKKRR
jgi:hypothetical protein